MKLDDLELGDYRLRFKLIEELNDEMIELLDELWENMDDDTDGYISDSYDTLDGVAWSIYWIRDIMKAEGVLLDLAQSFFLWDSRSVIGQCRLMSMSFKKKYSSS